MEENNQNIQVEKNNQVEKNESVIENSSVNETKKKSSIVAFIVCASICAVLLGFSIYYFVCSLNFEGFEAFALVFTIVFILGANIVASIVSIVNFIIVRKKSKTQKVLGLIMMLVVIAYSVTSLAVMFF